jgi:hypothetical protein
MRPRSGVNNSTSAAPFVVPFCLKPLRQGETHRQGGRTSATGETYRQGGRTSATGGNIPTRSATGGNIPTRGKNLGNREKHTDKEGDMLLGIHLTAGDFDSVLELYNCS